MPSATSPELPGPDAELQDALNELTAVLPATGKSQKTEADKHVRRICSIAYEHGLSDGNLDSLIDIVLESNGLNQTSLEHIINHLYPAGKVSDGLVCKVVGCLGQGANKPSPQVQAGLVRWVTMIYNVLNDRRILSRLYGTLFNLLDMMSLRKPLCHLLAIITRRKHVKPFRIQMLLELSRNFSYEPALGGLIRVYKDYYPDIILASVTYGRASNFSWHHPNQEWQTRLLVIQEARASKSEEVQTGLSGFKVFRSGAKSAVIPEVHTSHANEKSTTFEEVDNVDDFVNKLDKLELPNQVVSVLCDPLLQKYLAIRPSESSSKRIHHWLVTFFEEELELIQEGQKTSDRLGTVLESILSYTQYTKELPPACERFLELYLANWDGFQYREVILGLTTYVSSRPFEDLQTNFFDPIETAILDDSPFSRIILLEFYTSVLHNWVIRLICQPSTTSSSLASKSFTHLTNHLNTLSLSLYETTSSTTPSLQRTIPSILSLYKLLSTLPSETQIPITLPPTQLTYLLLFHPSLTTLSNLCSILANYKRGLESSSSSKPTTSQPPFPRQIITTFNNLITDTLNLLWRSRAFENQTQPYTTPIIPALQSHLEQSSSSSLNLPSLFSLSHHPVFANISKTCLDELQSSSSSSSHHHHPQEPVTPKSLAILAEKGGIKISWGEFRVYVLRYLNRSGVKGVGELVAGVMKGVDIGGDGGER